MLVFVASLALLVGCSSGDAAWDRTGACTALPFATESPVPEASGAAWQEIGGQRQIVVVGDSNNNGAYAILDPETGTTNEQGHLPLGSDGGDDVEGLAAVDGALIGQTSSGWIRVWHRDGDQFTLIDGPYTIAEVVDGGFACPGDRNNCGHNYEGLCLRPTIAPPGECAGFSASKADGVLYCLTSDGSRLHLDPSRSIAIAGAGEISDCGFDPDGATLWVGLNESGGAKVFVVDGWLDPSTATAREIDAFGPGSPEVLLPDRGALVYRFSDTGGSPSEIARYQCAVP